MLRITNYPNEGTFSLIAMNLSTISVRTFYLVTVTPIATSGQDFNILVLPKGTINADLKP